MNLAVIVPAYNAAHVLQKTVPAMLAQREPADWIFVDDGSTDGTGEALEALVARTNVAAGVTARVIRLGENRGRAAARTAGIDASGAAEIVVMLDVDAAPAEGFLAAHRAAHAGGAVAAMAQIHYAEVDTDEPYGRYLVASVRGPGPHAPSDLLPWRFFLTTACSVRREAFDRAGGFSTDLTYGEDLDLAARFAMVYPDGLRLAGSVHLYDNRDLEGALAVVREFGAENLPLMVARLPHVLTLGKLQVVAAGEWRYGVVRRLLQPVGRLARRLLPHTPERLVPRAVRVVLAAELIAAYREGCTRDHFA